MAQNLIIFAIILISAVVLTGCRDALIGEGFMSSAYEASLRVSGEEIEFYCVEDYLTRLHTKEELNTRITKAASNMCEGNFSVTKKQVKTMTVNPGEYYARASAKIMCDEGRSVGFQEDAKHLCRSLFGESNRSLLEGNIQITNAHVN